MNETLPAIERKVIYLDQFAVREQGAHHLADDKQAFLGYLVEVASAATPQVRAHANELYGVDKI